ncbi:MAG: c-type cytochrome [Bryobacteraceae bacterium]
MLPHVKLSLALVAMVASVPHLSAQGLNLYLPPKQNPAAVARGKQLFETNCSFCHGLEATGGNGGPDLVGSVLVNNDNHGNLIAPVVHNGRPDKGMPSFSSKLTKTQVSDIVAFLHQSIRDVRMRFSYKVQTLAIGSAAAGKTYFEAHCGNCHSATGDLKGIASKYPPENLQQLWLSPQSVLPRSANSPVTTVTVTLPSGPSFSGKLAHLGEFNVSLYDSQGYHSFPVTSGTKVQVHDPLAAHEQLLQQLTDSDMHNVTTYLETLK